MEQKIENLQDSETGVLTKKQLRVLELRSKGSTQREVAKQLGTTRANISMIEWRARRRLAKARNTIRAYDMMQEDFKVEIREGTKLVDVSAKVLIACDKRHVHLQSTIADILKVIKSKPDYIRDGRVSRRILLRVDRDGNLRSE